MKPHYPTRTDTRLTSAFGYRNHPVTGVRQSHHDGIDLAPKVPGTTGVPVYAVANGVVRRAEFNSISGKRVYIEHSTDPYTSVYCHLASYSVKPGQKVKRGQRIGIMGTTGSSTGIHLHFGLSKKYPVIWSSGNSLGSFINPVPYLDGKLTGLAVDGYWGRDTTRALQRYFKTPADGEIWGQVRNQATEAITGVKYGKGGSPLIKALQRKVGAKADGIFGRQTVTKLQQYLGTVPDGVISKPSTMVKEMQRRLNTGTF